MDGNVVEETTVADNNPSFGSVIANQLMKSGTFLCGALLYVFTLYTVLVNMIYPASVKPFLETDSAGQGKHLVLLSREQSVVNRNRVSQLR